MRVITYIIILSLFPIIVFGQTISRYTLSSAGGFFNENTSLDYSVGQIVSPTVLNSQLLTSGFQQPEFITDNNQQNDDEESKYEVNVFPNPTSDYVNIIITSEFDIENIDLNVFDITGKQIYTKIDKQKISNFTKFSIDFSTLETGEYLIQYVINNSIIKKQFVIKQ